jgi:hypothetical protein
MSWSSIDHYSNRVTNPKSPSRKLCLLVFLVDTMTHNSVKYLICAEERANNQLKYYNYLHNSIELSSVHTQKSYRRE